MTHSAGIDNEDPNKRSITGLEADIAYFQARRALVDNLPDTLYRRAQLRVCQVMEQSLGDILHELKQQQRSKAAKKKKAR